jgi:hypothetical protein
MPDASQLLASLVNLALETQLSEFVHQVDATKTSANNQNLCLEIVRIAIGGALSLRANRDILLDYHFDDSTWVYASQAGTVDSIERWSNIYNRDPSVVLYNSTRPTPRRTSLHQLSCIRLPIHPVPNLTQASSTQALGPTATKPITTHSLSI